MTNETERSSSGLAWLIRNRLPSAYALIGFGLVMLVLGALSAYFWRMPYLEVSVAAVLLAAITAGAGLWQLIREEQPAAELDLVRMLVLTVGGLSGLVVTLLGVWLAKDWWSPHLVTWLKVGEGQDLWRLLVVLGSLFGGLALMFASLQLGRTEERANAGLRRLLYGYNAVLTGLLLLAVLGLVNVFIYLKVPQTLDFTSSSFYTINPQSETLIRTVQQPLQVKAILRTGDMSEQLKALLEKCREANEKFFSWELLSPDLNPTRVEALAKKHSVEQTGLLVLYGPEDKQEFRFIKASDLFSDSGRPQPGQRSSLLFKGEELLMTEVKGLVDGKKPVIYVTQGNGEMDLEDRQPRGLDSGAGVLKEQLESRNYEVKPLTITLGKTAIPDDAAAVVVLGPRFGLPDFAIKSLEEYLSPTQAGKQPGKVVLLLNAPANKDMVERQKGLIAFLTRFQVQPVNDRILSGIGYENNDASQVIALAIKDNPVVTPQLNKPFQMKNARAFQLSPQGPMGSRFQVTPLLFCPGGQGLFLDTDLESDPQKMLEDFGKSPDNPPANLTLLQSGRPLFVALTVGTGSANDPHAGFGGPPVASKPSMVVIGDATMLSNRILSSGRGNQNLGLLTSSLGWLRERDPSVDIPPKKMNEFSLPPNSSNKVITLIPALLMLVCIVGLGAGVWVVRRR